MHHSSQEKSKSSKNVNVFVGRAGRLLFITSLLVLLNACSSAKDDLKIFSKCAIAAKHLGREDAKYIISEKLQAYIQENQLDGSAMDAMLLAEEVRDELGMYENGRERFLYTLVKVYNSSKCIDLHGHEKISMPFKYYLFYFFL